MNTKLYFYSQPNYLTSRTAIEAKILFAVCLSKKQALTGGKSLAREDKCSKKIGAALVQQADRRSFEASAVPALVYFYIIMIVHKYRQSAKRKLLLNNLTDRTFGNRRSRYKELGKKVPQAYLVYVEHLFLRSDAGDARIFSKEETGLYYYGARYLDPKYSRWLSGDPALNEYIPQAPVNDEAKKHNENLPGMGGVFNVVNLYVYHYAGNNPVKYTDPDGRLILMLGLSNTAGAGTGVSNNTGVFISIPLNGKDISVGSYTIYQTGAYVGLGVSSGIEFTVAPFAEEFSDIESFSLVGGGSFSFWGTAGAGLEVGYNPTAKTFSEKIQSITIAGAFSIGIPGGSPGEAHTWMAYTQKTSELNISKSYREIKQIYKDIQKFLKNKDIDGLLNYLKDKNLLPLEV